MQGTRFEHQFNGKKTYVSPVDLNCKIIPKIFSNTIYITLKNSQWMIMVMKGLSEKLIAPCGMNCRICIGFFGYTMNGEKRKIQFVGCKPS